MKVSRKLRLSLLAGVATVAMASAPASAQQKPNIIFIMGDDIGFMQPHIYHRGLMVGETPNIDRIGNEGALFVDYLAMQSCTSGRNAFFTGMYPTTAGQPVLLATGHPGDGGVPA
jgi:arylsulfatase A-like enzyme